jgi:branched-subunit amino acid ABC-type transport system permease component
VLLVAASYSLIYYPTKYFFIDHAATITMAAYFVFFCFVRLSISFAIAVLAGIAVSIVIGIICDLLVYRPMRKKDLRPLSYLIASIGLYVILQNALSLYFGDDTKVINISEITVGHQIFGAYITTVQIVTIFISLTLFFSINLFLHFTKIGKSIRAVSSNPELCNIYGISSDKTILIAFAIGSALAGVAGILSAMDTNMTPTFGFNLLLYGVVAMIIGGVGSTRGLLAGSLLVATSQHLAAFYLDTKWMDAVTYIILILFLIWKPLGFSGKRLKKVEV